MEIVQMEETEMVETGETKIRIGQHLLQPQNLFFLGVEKGEKLRVKFILEPVIFFLENFQSFVVPRHDSVLLLLVLLHGLELHLERLALS